jgi:hypothetical protein
VETTGAIGAGQQRTFDAQDVQPLATLDAVGQQLPYLATAGGAEAGMPEQADAGLFQMRVQMRLFGVQQR